MGACDASERSLRSFTRTDTVALLACSLTVALWDRSGTCETSGNVLKLLWLVELGSGNRGPHLMVMSLQEFTCHVTRCQWRPRT